MNTMVRRLLGLAMIVVPIFAGIWATEGLSVALIIFGIAFGVIFTLIWFITAVILFES